MRTPTAISKRFKAAFDRMSRAFDRMTYSHKVALTIIVFTISINVGKSESGELERSFIREYTTIRRFGRVTLIQNEHGMFLNLLL